MNNTKIDVAANELAAEIIASMNFLRQSQKDDEHVYAVVLVILDDFSDIQVYANTEQHFAKTDGSDYYRWHFAEFESEGMPVEFDVLTAQLGEVEDWDEDEEPENGNAGDRLVAMTLAMKHAQTQGAFNFDGKEATIYCSMVDSLNAIWLEDVSARFLNPPDADSTAKSRIKPASTDIYETDGKAGSSAFHTAYESRLPQ